MDAEIARRRKRDMRERIKESNNVNICRGKRERESQRSWQREKEEGN